MQKTNSDRRTSAMRAISAAYTGPAPLIPGDLPILLKSVISPDKIEQEIKMAEFVLSRSAAVA